MQGKRYSIHTMAYILQFTLFPLRYYLCLALDSSNIGRYRHPAYLPKGMADKGAGATAERCDRVRRLCHHSLFGEVVANSIGRHTNHYKFALRTSSDMHPYHYWFTPRTSSGMHPLLHKLAFYRTSASAVLPAERANFNTKHPRAR